MLKYLLSLLLLVSCGKPINDYLDDLGSPHGNSSTHPDFQSYIRSFEFHFSVRPGVPITYELKDARYAGTCNIWSDGYREIQINKTHWQTYNEDQREILIFHELSHCTFRLNHDDGFSFLRSCPESIMRSYMFNEEESLECYSTDKNIYIDDINNKIVSSDRMEVPRLSIGKFLNNLLFGASKNPEM